MGLRKSTVENMVNKSFWNSKKVLITGHTGFKGSWLSFWLNKLGSNVYGLALKPDTDPALFDQLQLQETINSKFVDIRDFESVSNVVEKSDPDVIIHMAAQPLVLRSYNEPRYTWETNVLGTINLLEAVKKIKKRCAVLVVTTDKVYDNREWQFSYREIDRLGGRDPYSSSKAGAELVVSSWRESFFRNNNHINLASARAGNVIGGGDWADNRLVPDIVRAIIKNEVIQVRNPNSIRPWQHVLDPLSGYLTLCEKLYQEEDIIYQSAYNFGPMPGNSQSVRDLVNHALSIWQGEWSSESNNKTGHEAGLLKVSIDKSLSVLGWKPKLNFHKSIEFTVDWYIRQNKGESPRKLMEEQLKEFMKF